MIFSRDLFQGFIQLFVHVFLYEANCKHDWHSFPQYLLPTTWPWFNSCNINYQKKNPMKKTPVPMVLTHTYTCTCTHLALKSCVAIYELAIFGVSQYACVTQPGGTEWPDTAQAFTPWTCLQHGDIYRRFPLCCWASCVHWGILPLPSFQGRWEVFEINIMYRYR